MGVCGKSHDPSGVCVGGGGWGLKGIGCLGCVVVYASNLFHGVDMGSGVCVRVVYRGPFNSRWTRPAEVSRGAWRWCILGSNMYSKFPSPGVIM
jgi:hypothetical protein